jgi:hypothetical protein
MLRPYQVEALIDHAKSSLAFRVRLTELLLLLGGAPLNLQPVMKI